MDTTLTGRTALITGGSKGIGRAIAEAYYQAGARVAVAARNAESLNAAVAEIAQLEAPDGARVEGFTADVSDGAQLEQLHTDMVAALGPVDILVNNAGHASAKPFAKITDADWQADFDLKLMAAVRLARLAWPGMEERQYGRIINVLNTFAKTPEGASAPTSVTRAAGMALTKVLANEGAPYNILVNAMLIGLIKSDQIRRQHQASGADISLDEFVAKAGKRLPMGRMGEASEAANLALFLASDAASYVTGCAINMDGGMSRVV